MIASDHTTELHPQTGIIFDRVGSGPPLVLIHGLGSSRAVWRTVLSELSADRDVILVDLPGFGETPPLPPNEEPSPARLADVVIGLLDGLELERPHVAGHSLGGWVALEIAARGRASSVTAIAPAGLWEGPAPLSATLTLTVMHGLARSLKPVAPLLARSAAARTAILWPQSGKPWSAPPEAVTEQAATFAKAPGFSTTLDAMRHAYFTGAAALDVPVTVAFGSRDILIDRWQSRNHNLLPGCTRWVTMRGCGHVPQWDDPAEVTRLLLSGSSGPLRARRHHRAGRSH